eukprot:g37301.t1
MDSGGPKWWSRPCGAVSWRGGFVPVLRSRRRSSLTSCERFQPSVPMAQGGVFIRVGGLFPVSFSSADAFGPAFQRPIVAFVVQGDGLVALKVFFREGFQPSFSSGPA